LIYLVNFRLTYETCRDNFEKKTIWEVKSLINSLLNDRIDKNKKHHFFSLKKIKVNLSQSTKLLTQIMHAIKFNKIYIPWIILHLIYLYDNKAYVIFVWNVFKKKKHDIAREIKITKGDVAF